MTATVAGIVLAGGAGRRFGCAKALVTFCGRPLVEHAASILARGGCQPVVVVLGAAAELVPRSGLGDVVVSVNADWEQGMGSSLRAGLAAANRLGASAALVLPCDQPVVTPPLVARLIETWQEGSPAVVASYGGEGRTPVVLDSSLWPSVAQSAVGDMGARGFLRSRPELVKLVDCDDVGEASDIDTPAELPTLEAAYRLRCPTEPAG
ncbi:MAG: NTP transferase domain-containing protein [Acidimicrobiales bacterium]